MSEDDGGEKRIERVMYCGREEELVVDKGYKIEEVLGAGASGVVARASNTVTGEAVAVKKVNWRQGGRGRKAGELSEEAQTLLAKRTLREMSIQAVLDHPNILGLLDVMVIPEEEADVFEDLYLVVELAEVDLRAVLSSGQELSKDHHVFFLYQILKGLLYLHSAGCMHRDLKPANCLTDAECNLKICDFGLAKQHLVPDYEAIVVTRAYRAPELFLDPYNYSEAIDMWALGMIVVEFMTHSVSPWINAPSDLAHLNALLDTFGPPPSDLIDAYPPDAGRYIRSYSFASPPRPLSHLFPDADPDLVHLATRMLDMDWRTRMTAAEALSLPIFTSAAFHDPDSELVAPYPLPPFDFELAPLLDPPMIRALIFNEMLRFHPEVSSQSYTPDLYTVLTGGGEEAGGRGGGMEMAMALSPNFAFGPNAPAFPFDDDQDQDQGQGQGGVVAWGGEGEEDDMALETPGL